MATNEELVALIQAGRKDLEEDLCQQNRDMIAKIANQLKGYAEFDDLMQEGYIGLLHAVGEYDPNEGTMFLSFAFYWIRHVMLRYIADNKTSVRIPVNLRFAMAKFQRAAADWQRDHNEDLPDFVACKLLKVDYQALDLIRAAADIENIQSLEAPVTEDLTLADMVPDDRDMENEVVDKVQKEQLATAVWSEVESLQDQQQNVIKLRYKDGLTVKQCGNIIGITESAVRNLENKALRTLRQPKHANQLRPYLDDTIRSKALRHVGLSYFRQTGESSVERTAIWLYELKKHDDQ